MQTQVTTSRQHDQARHHELGTQEMRPGQERLVGALVDPDHRLLLHVGEQAESLRAGDAGRARQLRAGARRATIGARSGAWVGAFLSAVAFGRFSIVIGSLSAYTGPLMPPSFRIRQKWTTRKMAVMSGKKMTCAT